MFQNGSGTMKLVPKKGISRLCIGRMLSHISEKLRRGTLRPFKMFLISKRFMDNKGEGVS